MQVLEIGKRTVDGVQVLDLTGRIVLGREGQGLEWDVDEMLKSGQNRIVFNMEGVSFIDSAGLGIIIGCFGKARQAGGALAVAAVTTRVSQVFEVAGVKPLLQPVATVEEAVQAMSGAKGAAS